MIETVGEEAASVVAEEEALCHGSSAGSSVRNWEAADLPADLIGEAHLAAAAEAIGADSAAAEMLAAAEQEAVGKFGRGEL